MSYEICAFDAAIASSKEAALEAWDDSSYWETSQLDYERSARKWRIKEALMAFNPALTCKEPKAPPTGFLAKVFGEAPSKRRYLSVNLMTGGECSTFDIYDQAVEIDLAWEAKADQVESIVRDVWRHLEKLSQSGFSTLYDTERDVLLNLETDFDVVMQGYIKNLELDDEDDDESSGETSPGVTVIQDDGSSVPIQSGGKPPHAKEVTVPQDAWSSVPREHKPQSPDTPFAGNVEEAKPWWKVW
jgi:hypothetical protein